MNRRRLAQLLLVAFVMAGPLAGCSSAAKTLTVSNVDDTIHTLAAGGIATMDDVRSTAPSVALSGTPSAMRFTRWQVQNLAAEADAHSGYLGSELDAIAEPPAGAPPLSTLIGAWLTRGDGALATYAARMMGTSDYKHSATLVFPTIVVLAFIGDIARVSPTGFLRPPRFDFERIIATPAEAEGRCTDVAAWVSNVISSVTSAIQANGTGWLASLWNTVVSIAGTVVMVAINGLSQSLIGFITHIATVCGTLMQVASMFKPWSVQLAADPTAMKLSSAPVPGKFVATLNATDIPWPSTLSDCVQALSGVKLDDASYTDAPVTWTSTASTPGLAVETSEDAKLLKDKTAAYHFRTKTVTPVPANECPRTVPSGNVVVTVSVARSDITRTLTSLESLITGQLPAAVQTYLAPYIQPALTEANSTAAEFAAPHESATIPVTEDVADPLCPQTPPPNAPSSAPTTLSGHGTLPSGTCESVLTPADTQPAFNGGIVFVPVDEHGQTIDMGKMMGQLMTGAFLTPPGGHSLTQLTPVGHDPQYDTTQGSYCVIGKPPATVEAFGAVIPKGTAPYHPLPDIRADDARSPRACRTAIGLDLLIYDNADCRDQQFGGGTVSVTLYGPTVEYIITAMNGISAGTVDAVFKRIAERSRN